MSRIILLVALLGAFGFEVLAQEVASRPVIEVGLLSTFSGKGAEVDVRTSMPMPSLFALRSSWVSNEGAKAFVVFDFRFEDDDEHTTSFAEFAFGPGVSQNRRGAYGALTGTAMLHSFSMSFEVERSIMEEKHHGPDLWAKATVSHRFELAHDRVVEMGLMYHHNHILDFKGVTVAVPFGEHHSARVWSAVSPQGAVLFGLAKHW